MTESYNIGDLRTFTATFTDKNGAAADPTTVTAKVRKPDGTESVLSTNNPSVGTWTAEYEFDQPGRHTIHFLGDGALNTAVAHEVYIRHKGVA